MLRRWCPSAGSERRGGENCQARQWFVRPSTDPRTGAALGHLGCAACSDSRDAGRPIRCLGPLTAGAADRCRRRDRQSHAGVSDECVHHGASGSGGPTRASLRRAGLRSGKQSKAAFPEEHLRRLPPSTSCPCPAWFSLLSGPFFRRRETAVEKRSAPIELPVLVQFRQECAPNGEPDPLPFAVSKPPPAGGR